MAYPRNFGYSRWIKLFNRINDLCKMAKIYDIGYPQILLKVDHMEKDDKNALRWIIYISFPQCKDSTYFNGVKLYSSNFTRAIIHLTKKLEKLLLIVKYARRHKRKIGEEYLLWKNRKLPPKLTFEASDFPRLEKWSPFS